MARTPLNARGRALGLSVVAAFVLLAGTAEERTFGTVSDEQQMLYTAISIATTGEIVPLLAAAAGTAAATPVRRAAGVVLAVLGVAMNGLGTFQAEAATFHYVSSTGLARVSRALYEEYPPSFRPPESRDGAFFLPRYVPAASDPAFSALCVQPFLLANRLMDGDENARRSRLAAPPWLATSPDAVPRLAAASPQITTQTPLVLYLASAFRWPHLFMSATHPRAEQPGTYNTAWVAGLADQTMRSGRSPPAMRARTSWPSRFSPRRRAGSTPSR